MRKTYLKKQKQTSFAIADIYQMLDFFNMITIIIFFYFTNIMLNYSKEVLCHPWTKLHKLLGDKAQFKRRKNSTWMHYVTLSVSTCPLLRINSNMFIVAYALTDYRLK